ncbi:hypothetical protein ACFWD7_26550 [Streptomyces mirabilis]|uniref:hypothetical protein n=1 Tax=Streptomyces mirabilis TaxID=68239 RepID=UPI0036A00F1F
MAVSIQVPWSLSRLTAVKPRVLPVGTAQGEADSRQGLGDFHGVLVVGAVDHAHVVVERFEHSPGLDESSL